MDHCLQKKKRLPFTVHFVCLLHRSPWLPRRSMLWLDSDGEDGWRVNYMLSKVRLTQQTLKNSTEGTSWFYWNCKEGWISREKVSTYMCQPQTHGQFQLWAQATVSTYSFMGLCLSVYALHNVTHHCVITSLKGKCLTLLNFSALWGSMKTTEAENEETCSFTFICDISLDSYLHFNTQSRGILTVRSKSAVVSMAASLLLASTILTVPALHLSIYVLAGIITVGKANNTLLEVQKTGLVKPRQLTSWQ